MPATRSLPLIVALLAALACPTRAAAPASQADAAAPTQPFGPIKAGS